MTGDDILSYCLKKPGAFLDHPFGPDADIVKVRASKGAARIFAQVFTLKGAALATFSCNAMTGDMYRQLYPEAVTRGYHCPPVQQPYFNTVKLDGSVPDDILRDMMEHAYRAVVAKLPKYAQRELLK